MRPFCPTRPALYWKNWRSALERHVVEVFGARFRVRRRREAGELPEIVDEMALIVVAAFQREIRPIDLGSHAADGANRALKPLHAREGLGRETDLAPENLGEPPPGHTRSFHDPRNRAPWIAPDLPQRERHRRMPLHRPHRPAHQKTLRRREPGRCRWSREQLVAQRIGRASPQAIQSDLLIAQLIERHRQKREQAARFEMKAEDGKLRRRVDHGVLRPRSAQDHPTGLAERRAGLAVVQRHAVLRQIDHDLHRPIRQDALQRMRPRDALPQPQALDKSIERRGWPVAQQHRAYGLTVPPLWHTRIGPMTLDELRSRYRSLILETAGRYGAHNVRVFGSVARGEQSQASDVDLVVDFDAGRSLLDLAGLLLDLEQALGCKVDVVSSRGLRPRVGSEVLRDAVPL